MDNELKELITKYNIRLRDGNDLALNKKTQKYILMIVL